MANVDILVGEKVRLSIVPTLTNIDADLVGTPTWSAASSVIAHLQPADDGLTCLVTGKSVGSTVVTASALGASALTANHNIVVAASNLANAIVLTVERNPGVRK
jgi:hypothetical protein